MSGGLDYDYERLLDLAACGHDSREWAQIRNALDYYASPDNWGKDDWGVRAVLTGRGGYGNPTEKAKRALDAMRRLERKGDT